ncbi:MAG: Stp1/IreP family PP2C-type Ser/Thr phosphatase [Oscillospiraceae bacterium]
MKLYGMTDTGLKRSMNQDVFYAHKFSDDVGFVIVCDGMGGENAGNVASAMACDIVSKNIIEKEKQILNGENIDQIIVDAISKANVLIYKKAIEEATYKGMGTTLVLALIVNSIAYIAHIGDSRVYHYKNGNLNQITKDHSRVQELLEQGKINKEEMAVHPEKNVITRAVGVYLTVDIDYITLQIENGSKILLCTDGLTNMLDDAEIEKCLKKSSAQAICEKLIELANKNGGIDNITIAIME